MEKKNGGRSLFRVWIFIAAAVLATTGRAWATSPPVPGEIEALKAAGLFEKRLRFVQEVGNHRVHPGLAEKLAGKLRNIRLEYEGLPAEEPDTTRGGLPAGRYGMPSVGAVKTFALLIEFDDIPHTISQGTIDDMLFGDGDPANYPLDSLANYYERSSYGLLDLSNGATLGWYKTDYDRIDVLENRDGRENLIKEALRHYEDEHDFSQYDNDGDSFIDYFMVFWTGENTGWGSFWWAYQTGWNDGFFFLDGKRLRSYSWQREKDHPGTVIHETGHGLGLPDYYDYDDEVGPDGGLGNFDMMDANQGDHNCFSKWMLDWVTPVVVSQYDETMVLDDAATTGDCVMIWPGAGLDDIFSEFFLVENRQYTANDESFHYTPDGLAIWHVDATLDDDNFAFNNSNTVHKLLRLMEADGLEEIEDDYCINPPADPKTDPWGYCNINNAKSCASDASCQYATAVDLYSPGDVFSPESTPSSDDYYLNNTGVRVWNVIDLGPSPGDEISAIFAIAQNCGQPVTTPELGLPEDDAVDVGLNPILGWTWQYGIGHYQLQICENSVCTDVVRDEDVTMNSWYVHPALEHGTRYWWRVRARNNCEITPWSQIRTFETFCPFMKDPYLIIPAADATGASVTPTLNWEYISGALAYDVQVCNNASCSSVELSSERTVNYWVLSPALTEGAQYFWRVRAKNECMEGDWSEIRKFTTQCVPLDRPMHLSPAHGAEDLFTAVELSWTGFTQASDYDVQVCGDSLCSSVLEEHNTDEEQWVFNAEMSSNYWWRIKANKFCGSSEWSGIWVFSTVVEAGAPGLFAPSDGCLGLGLTPFLDWFHAEGAVSYDVRVCEQGGGVCNPPAATASGLATSQWTVSPPLEKDTLYTWSVLSQSANGIGNRSAYREFRTCADPVVPVLTNPSHGASGISLNAYLSWEQIPYPSGYDTVEVQVCSDSDCSTVVDSQSVYYDNYWTVDPALSEDVQYYWRARHVNNCGTGAWSAVRSFTTTDCVTPPPPVLDFPSDGFPSVPVNASFTWHVPTSGAYMQYAYPGPWDIEVCADSNCSVVARSEFELMGYQWTATPDLDHSTQYWWRVRSHRTCGAGSWGQIYSFATVDCWTPPTPSLTDPGIRIDSGQTYTVQWDRDPFFPATHYTIEESTEDDFSNSASFTTASTSKAFSHTVSGCSGVAYYYRVKAENACGASAWQKTPVDMTVNPNMTPDSPSLASPANGATNVALSPVLDWYAVHDASTYHVQLCQDSICNRIVAENDHAVDSSWTVPVDLNGTSTYWWRAKASTDCGASAWSPSWSFETQCATPPAPTVDAPGSPVPSGQNYTLSWTALDDVSEYTVLESRDLSFSRATSYSASRTSLSFEHWNSRCSDTVYYYAVAGQNRCGLGEWSKVAQVAIQSATAPDAPGELIYSVGDCDGWFDLKWPAADGASVYFVQRCSDENFSETETIYSGPSTTCEEKGLPDGEYYYRVRAENACGHSSWTAGQHSVQVGGAVIGVQYLGHGDCDDKCPCDSYTDSAFEKIISPGTVHVMKDDPVEDMVLNSRKRLELKGWDPTCSTPSKIDVVGPVEIWNGCLIFSGGSFEVGR